MTASRDWTPDEVATLNRLLAIGLGAVEIAPALNRTPAAVYTKLCKLGLRRRPRPTPEIVERIERLLASGLRYAEIVAQIGIPRDRVESYCRRHGLVGPRSSVSRTERAFDAEIVELSNAGLNNCEIARRLEIREWTVRCRLTTLARRDAVREARS